MKTTLYILTFILLGFQNDNSKDIFGKYISTSHLRTTHSIVFSSRGSFNSTFQGEIATITFSGEYERLDDTLFLTYNIPAISNNMDTFYYEDHFQRRRDTFWIKGENRIVNNPKDDFGGYFQYEKHDENGNILIKKEWQILDTSIVRINEEGFKNIIKISR